MIVLEFELLDGHTLSYRETGLERNGFRSYGLSGNRAREFIPPSCGTISFTVCFAAWGSIGAFAPRFRETFHLTASETAFLVAVPVLLGSLARIPMGILTDRFGGRAIFSILMAAVACRSGWRRSKSPAASHLWGPAGSCVPAGGRRLLVCNRCRLRFAMDAC